MENFCFAKSRKVLCVTAGLVGLSLAAALYPAAGNAQQQARTAVSTMTSAASAPELTMPAAQLTPQQIASMQRQLADWPQLARYRDDNLQLTEPLAGQHRVVFFGDSITYAWGRLHGKFFPDQPWINRGISGQTTPQMVLRFQQDVLALHPDAVVILAGINDIAGNTGVESMGMIEDNFRSMVALARSAHVRVVLSSVLPANHFPWRPGVDPRAEVVALNTWLQQFAREQQVSFLNYYPAMAAPDGGMRPELTVDGVHPNDAGYVVMEPLARAAVSKALAEARP